MLAIVGAIVLAWFIIQLLNSGAWPVVVVLGLLAAGLWLIL